MPNQTKFVLEADAAKAVQEFLRLRDAEKKVDDGQRALAGSARTTEAAVVSAARASAREYELAGERINRAMPLPRTFGGSYIPRGRNVAGFDIQSLPSSVLRGPAATVPGAGAGAGYAMATEIRADQNLERFNALMERGNKMHADAEVREKLDFERRARNVEHYAARQQQAHDQLWGGLKAGLVTGTLAVAAIDAAAERFTTDLNNVSLAGEKLEDDLKPLLSLGNNAKNSVGIRGEVLGMSGAYGMDTNAISSALFMLQSTASNLGPKIQQDIFTAGVQLNRVAGGDLKTDLIAVTKLMQNYGNELKTANKAAAELFKTQELAAIAMDELSTLEPDVLPAAKLAGISPEEVGASIITTTQVMGSNEKALTGLRNMYLKLGEAQKAGLVHQGSFNEKVLQLNKVNPLTLEKFFGERTVSVVKALADHTGDLARNIKAIQQASSADLMGKYLDRQADPISRDADIVKSVNAEAGNVDAMRFANPEIRNLDILTNFAKIGYDANVSPMMKAFSMGEGKWIANAGRYAANFYPGQTFIGKDWVDYGFNQYIGDKLKAGDPQSLFDANVMKLKFGALSGTSVNGRPTSDSDVQNYINLEKSLHGNLRMRDFLQYEGMAESKNPAAPGYLAQLKKQADAQAAKEIAFADPTAKSPAGSAGAAADKLNAVADKMGKHMQNFGQSVATFSRGVKDRNRNIH